jgi:hypothetical protein
MIFSLPKGFTELKSSGASTALVAWAAAVAAVGIFGGAQAASALGVLGMVGIFLVIMIGIEAEQKGKGKPPASKEEKPPSSS